MGSYLWIKMHQWSYYLFLYCLFVHTNTVANRYFTNNNMHKQPHTSCWLKTHLINFTHKRNTFVPKKPSCYAEQCRINFFVNIVLCTYRRWAVLWGKILSKRKSITIWLDRYNFLTMNFFKLVIPHFCMLIYFYWTFNTWTQQGGLLPYMER